MNIAYSKKSSFSGAGLAGVCRLGRHKLSAATPALEALASKAFVHGLLNAGVGRARPRRDRGLGSAA